MYKWLATNWMISQNLYIKKMFGEKNHHQTSENHLPSIRRKKHRRVVDFVGTKGIRPREEESAMP